MTIEYVEGSEPHVEHVAASDLPRWTAEHPAAVILHATPDSAEASAASEDEPRLG